MKAMKDPGSLHEALSALTDRLGGLLATEVPLAAWGQTAPRLEKRLQEIERRAQLIDSTLVLLLLGGTGVGKSTLLNALAHEEVASVSSAKRAHTYRLNLYHHAEVDPSPLVEGFQEEVETHTHRAAALLEKVIIDAPDVDSTETAHRDLVQRFLPRVDVVIYTSSWQKYKDRDVVDLVATLKGSHFFLFCLNQIDRVRPPEREGLLDDAREALRGLGFEAPRVLGISALGALRGGDAGDFAELESILRERLRGQQIRAIKESGLLGRLRGLLGRMVGALTRHADLGAEALAAGLEEVARTVEADAGALRAALTRELNGVFGQVCARFEQRYHELRDREVGGPYGLFLRLYGRVLGDARGGVGRAARGGERQAALRMEAAIAAAYDRALARSRALGAAPVSGGAEAATGAGRRLVDRVTQQTDRTFLAELPPPRSALGCNLAPGAAGLGTLGLLLYLALIGRDPGLVVLLAGLLFTLTVCAIQYAALRALDRRTFRKRARAATISPADVLESEPALAALGDTRRGLERSAALVREVLAAQAEIQALGREVKGLPSALSR